MSFYDVGVIIPAYNEEEFLGKTLKALKTVSIVRDIVVVDDGSTDRTGDIALNEGVRVIPLEKNYGKGHALMEGLLHANNSVIVIMDADIGDTSTEVIKLVHPVLYEHYDAAIGKVPFTPGKGGIGMVKGLSQLAYRLLTGSSCSSILSGQRAFKREAIDPNIFKYRGFGVEFGMTVDLAWRKLKIIEVPIEISHRVTGRDIPGYKHRFAQFMDISCVVLRKTMELATSKGERP